MNKRWQKFVEINKLLKLGEDLEDLVEINLILIDEKLSAGDGLKLPLGSGLEAMLFRFDSRLLTDESLVPTSIFTVNGAKKLGPLDRSRYYFLEQKTLQIRVLFVADIMLGWMVVNLLNHPARVLAKALAFSYGGNFYTAAHRNGRILAKALLTNTNPKLVALLDA